MLNSTREEREVPYHIFTASALHWSIIEVLERKGRNCLCWIFDTKSFTL